MKPKIVSVVVVVFFLILALPLAVLAQENFRSEENVLVPKGQTIDKDYFSAGESIIIDGTINGDLYSAGGDITVNGDVNGDILAVSGNLNINGKVTDNIRAVSGNINIIGSIGRNVTLLGGSINVSPAAHVGGSLSAAGGNVNVSGTVLKEVNLAAGQANIGGKIGSDLAAGVGNLIVNSTSSVGGDINYWSEKKAVINPSASVRGRIIHNLPPKKIQKNQSEKSGQFASLILAPLKIISFITALVIGLLLIKLMPNFMSRMTGEITTNWLQNLGVGFLTLAITPIMMIMLLVSVIGIPVAVVWGFFIVSGLWLAKIFVAIAVGAALMKYFQKTGSTYLTYLFGLTVLYLVGLLPVLGWIFGVITTLVGLGAIILTKKSYYAELRQKKLL